MKTMIKGLAWTYCILSICVGGLCYLGIKGKPDRIKLFNEHKLEVIKCIAMWPMIVLGVIGKINSHNEENGSK